jgi:hypothetical protein
MLLQKSEHLHRAKMMKLRVHQKLREDRVLKNRGHILLPEAMIHEELTLRPEVIVHRGAILLLRAAVRIGARHRHPPEEIAAAVPEREKGNSYV